jgi:hypothetical protein
MHDPQLRNGEIIAAFRGSTRVAIENTQAWIARMWARDHQVQSPTHRPLMIELHQRGRPIAAAAAGARAGVRL